ncbi:MAG: hypothetical protein RRB13_11390 [bacterium]|nr:hypothetical protein [bacterium]
MTTATPIKALCLILAFLWAAPLWAAYEELRVETNNEFGGRTIVFRNNLEGISEGKNFYDSAGKIMREERDYTDDWANAHGTKSLLNEYLFDIKIKEVREYSPAYAARRLIKKQINYYEQATGTLVRTENHFAQAHLGYNIVYFDLGTKTRMEWFYPANELGYQKVISTYDKKGKLLQTESFFTEKSADYYGCVRSILVTDGEKKLREEWFFTEKWAAANNGAVRKVKVYFYNPSYPQDPKIYYFNGQDEVVQPVEPFED